MNRHSVGIELCNFGYLKEGRTYVGTKSLESQRAVLQEEFRKYKTWHKLSDEQIKAAKKTLEYVSARDNIDLQEGLVKWIRKDGVAKAFDFQRDAYDGKVKGLLVHSNVRKDKRDVHPQDELIDMLLTF
jgi:hypothetical protein